MLTHYPNYRIRRVGPPMLTHYPDYRIRRVLSHLKLVSHTSTLLETRKLDWEGSL